METKKCPFCGEEILAAAKKCEYCGEQLDEKAPANEEEIDTSESESFIHKLIHGEYRKWGIAALVVLGIVCGVIVYSRIPSGSVEEAEALFKQRRFEPAVKMLTELAEHGDTAAQYKLYEVYKEGKLYKRDGKEAMKWLKTAAENNHIRSQVALAEEYRYNKDNKKEAIKWYEKAGNQGRVYAMNEAASLYEYQKEYDKAFEWYKKAAEKGSLSARFKVAETYRFGRGVEVNIEEAIKYFSPMLNAGNKDYEAAAIHHLEWIAFEELIGEHGKNKEKNAFEIFSMLAKGGDSRSLFMLGVMYAKGLGVGKDIDKAKDCIESAAEKGYAYAIKYKNSLVASLATENANSIFNTISINGKWKERWYETDHSGFPFFDGDIISHDGKGIALVECGSGGKVGFAYSINSIKNNESTSLASSFFDMTINFGTDRWCDLRVNKEQVSSCWVIQITPQIKYLAIEKSTLRGLYELVN